MRAPFCPENRQILDLGPNFGTNFFLKNQFFGIPNPQYSGIQDGAFFVFNTEFWGFGGTSAKLSFGAIVSNLQTLKNQDIWTFGQILDFFLWKFSPKNPPISSLGLFEAFWDLF